jgi:hypothetical protein
MSRKKIISSRSSRSTPSTTVSTGLDEATKLVGQVTKIIGTAPALSVKDRKRSPKLRKGGETVIPTVAALSDRFGLTVADHPTTTMVQSAKKAQSLIPLYKQLVLATKQVADQMFSANSESWGSATVHYTMLKRLAKTNGDLETALAPVEQFFAHRSPAVIADEKVKKDARKAAKAAKSAAKATPAVATTPSAPAPASPAPTVTPAAPSTPTAAPVTPAPTSAAPV